MTRNRFSCIFVSVPGAKPEVMPERPASRALAGETVVFAGRLSSLSRRDAHAVVRLLGGTPAEEGSPRTTIIVLGTGAGPGPLSATHCAASSPAGAGRRVRTMGEDEFCRIAGLPQPTELRSKYYASSEIIGRYPPLGEAHLRYLEKWRLISPVARTWGEAYYAFQDLVLIRQVSAELQRGVPLRSVIRSLHAERCGQLSLDFRAPGGGGKVLSIAAHHGPALPAALSTNLEVAERLFLEASAI
ncbi:MAG: hypothetical protein EHM13_10255, partial [Acidobacteria bacterium]